MRLAFRWYLFANFGTLYRKKHVDTLDVMQIPWLTIMKTAETRENKGHALGKHALYFTDKQYYVSRG